MEKSTHSRHCIGEKKGKPRNPRRDCDNGLARRLYSRLSVRTSLMSLALATLLPHHRFPGNQRFHPPSPCSTKVSSPHRIESPLASLIVLPPLFYLSLPSSLSPDPRSNGRSPGVSDPLAGFVAGAAPIAETEWGFCSLTTDKTGRLPGQIYYWLRSEFSSPSATNIRCRNNWSTGQKWKTLTAENKVLPGGREPLAISGISGISGPGRRAEARCGDLGLI